MSFPVRLIFGIVLSFFLFMNTPGLRAQSQVSECFPESVLWGSSPKQLTASRGQPHQPLKSIDFTVYTYPFELFDVKGDVSYYFDKNGLNSVQYVFPASQDFKDDDQFARLESALECLAKTPGTRLNAQKNEVSVRQAIWEDDRTLVYLSSFSSSPEITVKFLDKTVKENQVEVELFQKIKSRKSQ